MRHERTSRKRKRAASLRPMTETGRVAAAHAGIDRAASGRTPGRIALRCALSPAAGTDHVRRQPLYRCIGLFLSVAFPAMGSPQPDAAIASPAYAECWKATFTEQTSGPTRMRYVKGSDQDFTHSYDGPFRWIGEPTITPVTVVYRYCFAKSKEDGGGVILDSKTIPLGRVGSSKLPNGGKSTTGYSDVSIRNLDVFDSLYGRFQGEGGKVTSLQVELDRQRMTTAVITHTTEGRKQTTTYMKGETVRDTPPR
jgi:hypothetical protein